MTKLKPAPVTIVLFVVAFIISPLLTSVGLPVWLLYRYGLGGRYKNQRLASKLERIKRKWLISAALLMLLTLPIHSTTDHATHFGFPTTVLTYYSIPTHMAGIAYWFDPWSGSAINPLQAVVNWIFYLLLLLLLDRLWQSLRTWRKIGV